MDSRLESPFEMPCAYLSNNPEQSRFSPQPCFRGLPVNLVPLRVQVPKHDGIKPPCHYGCSVLDPPPSYLGNRGLPDEPTRKRVSGSAVALLPRLKTGTTASPDLSPADRGCSTGAQLHMGHGQNSVEGDSLGFFLCPCYRAIRLYVRSFDPGSYGSFHESIHRHPEEQGLLHMDTGKKDPQLIIEATI